MAILHFIAIYTRNTIGENALLDPKQIRDRIIECTENILKLDEESIENLKNLEDLLPPDQTLADYYEEIQMISPVLYNVYFQYTISVDQESMLPILQEILESPAFSRDLSRECANGSPDLAPSFLECVAGPTAPPNLKILVEALGHELPDISAQQAAMRAAEQRMQNPWQVSSKSATDSGSDGLSPVGGGAGAAAEATSSSITGDDTTGSETASPRSTPSPASTVAPSPSPPPLQSDPAAAAAASALPQPALPTGGGKGGGGSQRPSLTLGSQRK
jgi:hypothetical protein